MLIARDKSQTTQVEGVVRRKDGSIRMVIKETQRNGVTVDAEVRYLDPDGNDVTTTPWMAYEDSPEVYAMLLEKSNTAAT